MPLSHYSPIATEFVARAIICLRDGTQQGERRRLARHYRGMSDHGLADIGFCRTRIDLQVFADIDRR